MNRFIHTAFLLILLAHSALSSAATEMIIWGTGSASPLGTHPTTTVQVYDKSDSTLLGTTTTDDNGDYSVLLNFVGIGNKPSTFEDGARLIQNPSSDVVQVELSSGIAQDWLIQVYDGSGRLICSQNLALSSGVHIISLGGLGNAGIKTISLKSAANQYALKAILTASAPLSPRITTSLSPRPLKSTIVGDSLLVVFTPPDGFIGTDTTVYMQSQQVNYMLEQIPYEYNYTVYAYDITDGSPVIDNTALKFNWANGTSSTFYSDDGIINIYYSTYDTATNVFIENGDTSYYQEWIFGVKRENLITTKELNLFQNEKVQSPGPIGFNNIYVYPTPAPANLAILPDTFDVYFVPVIVYDSEDQPWSTRDSTFRLTVATRCDPILWTKKWEIGQWDTTYLYEMQLFENTMNLITPEQSLAQEITLDSVIAQVFYLRANGRQLFPRYKRVKIYTMTESEYLAGEAREWDQVHVSQYGNNNENVCAFTSDSTFSGYWRFKAGVGIYWLTSNMTYRFTEICQSFTHTHDPPNGNMGGKITYLNGHMTTFGLVQCHLILLADPATIFW